MAHHRGTSAADKLVDDVREQTHEIEAEAYDLAIDAVGDCDRYDIGENEMVKSATGAYIDADEAQDAIRSLQR